MSTILSSYPETSIWSAPSAPLKLHSRAREAETTCCAGVTFTKSLERIEIPQWIEGSCVGLGLLSKDPIGFAAGDTNLYRMTGNHPNMATDPSGLEEKRGRWIFSDPQDAKTYDAATNVPEREEWAEIVADNGINGPLGTNAMFIDSFMFNRPIQTGAELVRSETQRALTALKITVKTFELGAMGIGGPTAIEMIAGGEVTAGGLLLGYEADQFSAIAMDRHSLGHQTSTSMLGNNFLGHSLGYAYDIGGGFAAPRIGKQAVELFPFEIESRSTHMFSVSPITLFRWKRSGDPMATVAEGYGLVDKELKTLASWLHDEPVLLEKLRSQYRTSPEWQGIDPDKTSVFYRNKAEVDAIRAQPGENGGHHPHGLALGGPEGQLLTTTNETRKLKNANHSTATGLQRQVINRINGNGNE